MKSKLKERLEELKAKKEHFDDLYALESYELAILQSFHDKDLPNYDDLEDYLNMTLALNRVQSLIIQETFYWANKT